MVYKWVDVGIIKKSNGGEVVAMQEDLRCDWARWLGYYTIEVVENSSERYLSDI